MNVEMNGLSELLDLSYRMERKKMIYQLLECPYIGKGEMNGLSELMYKHPYMKGEMNGLQK